MHLNAKQKERISESVRFIISAVFGSIMISFANFTLLTGYTDGTIYVILMLFFGVLIGMYSSEIHYAILSGMLSIFLGFIIYYVFLTMPVVIFASWTLYDILILFGISNVVRVVMLQLVGILMGTVIGRIIGPGWYEPTTPKHKLKIGVPSAREKTE